MTREKPAEQTESDSQSRGGLVRLLPFWIVVCGVVALVGSFLPNMVAHYESLSRYSSDERRLEALPSGQLAPLFTAEVDYWQADILRWAAEAQLDPDLVATIIQIESCGDPQAQSPAGAQGLMQVMPLHFAVGEDMLDPDTNARRGLSILSECLNSPYNPQKNVGLAFACYNGGPSVFVYAWANWPEESRYYYTWGTGIYADTQTDASASETLQQWVAAGGSSLCQSARLNLQLRED